MLLVGNHSGGNLTPDTIVFTVAFYTYFGVERPFYQLAHNLVLASPAGPLLRRYGTVSASHEHAREALEAGAAVLVYPGGDWEVHRPSWEGGKVDFDGRKGFIRLARDAGVPIVPVVSVGGQETALFLSHGSWPREAARRRQDAAAEGPADLDRRCPGSSTSATSSATSRCRRRSRSRCSTRSTSRSASARRSDVDEAYDARSPATMQDALDGLAAERRLPVIG